MPKMARMGRNLGLSRGWRSLIYEFLAGGDARHSVSLVLAIARGQQEVAEEPAATGTVPRTRH